MDADALLLGLGQAFRARRERQGWSQEAFAQSIGLHRTYYSAIERGERNPSFRNLHRIAEGLDLPLSTILKSAEKLAQSG